MTLSLLNPTLIDKDEEMLIGFPTDTVQGRIIRHDEGYLWLGDVTYSDLRDFFLLVDRIVENGYGCIIPLSDIYIYNIGIAKGYHIIDINEQPCFLI